MPCPYNVVLHPIGNRFREIGDLGVWRSLKLCHFQARNSELQAVNSELQAVNSELQAVNSKLQATN
ncbi:hypothetical protein [Microseira wollei]|uniref:hypothetical protein n=1 Tax=Microseira wollei TaxID=467598 RepID=UPI001CFD85E1|nr:hypothetical protein [Microseira wollei]